MAATQRPNSRWVSLDIPAVVYVIFVCQGQTVDPEFNCDIPRLLKKNTHDWPK